MSYRNSKKLSYNNYKQSSNRGKNNVTGIEQ